MINPSQFKTTSLIVKLGNAVTYYRNLKMQDIDLTSVQSDAIISILRNPNITASELKDSLQLSQSTVAGIISRLDNKGILNKTVSTDDARKAILTLTPAGIELEDKLKDIAVQTQHALLEGMSEEEQAEFERLLEIALENMNRIRMHK